MTSEQIIDCHAHIIDPACFPFGAMETPRPLHRRVPSHDARHRRDLLQSLQAPILLL